MHGLNNDSINWLSSDSIWNYYDKMTKRYLKQHDINDFTKYELALIGHSPHFIRWEYSDITQPCINRIKKVSNNYFEFDQRARVTFTNQNINIVRHQRIHIYTTENKHFKTSSKFMPPSFGYYVTGVKDNQIVNVIINPLTVQYISFRYWVFLYKITANKTCEVDIIFRFKYVYHESQDEAEEEEPVVENAEETLQAVVVSLTETQESTKEDEQDIPVEQEQEQEIETQQEQPTFRSEDDIVADKSTLKRSSSLRSSLKKVQVPNELKEDFKPITRKTYFALDNKTYKRLTKQNN